MAKENLRRYKLIDFESRERLNELADENKLKDLTEEIAMTRLMIERRWNAIKDEATFTSAIPAIQGLMVTLERLMKTAHTIEQNLSVLLTKPTLMRVCQEICLGVREELEAIPGFEEIVDRINTRIINSVVTAHNEQNQ